MRPLFRQLSINAWLALKTWVQPFLEAEKLFTMDSEIQRTHKWIKYVYRWSRIAIEVVRYWSHVFRGERLGEESRRVGEWERRGRAGIRGNGCFHAMPTRETMKSSKQNTTNNVISFNGNRVEPNAAVIHLKTDAYFNTPQSEARRWRSWCSQRSLWLLKDWWEWGKAVIHLLSNGFCWANVCLQLVRHRLESVLFQMYTTRGITHASSVKQWAKNCEE